MPTDDVLKQDLERMRMRLLDLSARNALLNYSHPRASSLRIVDEVPALVIENLLAEGDFRFAALKLDNAPAPVRETSRRAFGRRGAAADGGLFGHGGNEQGSDDSALQSQSNRERREAAKVARARREEQITALAQQLGINPSYDLPDVVDSDAERYGDRRLQTLLTPEELEVRLHKMQAAAVTAIQETGANMLHLIFGFVEWMDVVGGKTRVAPLVLLPVTLSRLELEVATHTFPYRVAASGEDWSTNVTLQEKCRKDFGFVLPGVEDEENLGDYFVRVEEVLRSAPPGWRVRRQLTLGLVSFGKILMWRDLDPATWPNDNPLLGNPLLGNPLLREVLGADDTLDENQETPEGAEARTSEYNIDKLPPECGSVPPIVLPADSSQHSVLVDVQRGDSLVVQGPPGTGKSQTITNIIAAAIAARKKILFVAEKKAALDVVARRLVEAGLGPFCLPLHSHTSNKRKFLDDLKERIDLSGLGDSGADMATVEGLLNETRSELTGHAERLHAPFGCVGDTAFSILWRVRRLGTEMPDEVLAALRGALIPNAVHVTPGDLARNRAMLTAFAAAQTAAGTDKQPGEVHPWHGVSRADLNFDDSEALLALAGEARPVLAAAERARQAVQGLDGRGCVVPESLTALAALLPRYQALTPPQSAVPTAVIETIHARAGVVAVRAAVAAADLARSAWSNVWGPWSAPGSIISEAVAADYAERVRRATLVFGDGRTVEYIRDAIETLAKTSKQLSATETLAAELAAELGVTAPLSVGLAMRLVEFTLAADQLQNGALALRSIAMSAPGAAGQNTALASRAAALSAMGEQFDARFAPEMRPSLAELRQLAGAFAAAPRFLPILFSGVYRRAGAHYRRMGGGRQADRATMTADIDTLIRHAGAYDAFVNDPALPRLFGSAADGVRTPFGHAAALLAWTKNATAAFRGAGESGRLLSDAVWSATASSWSRAGGVALSNPAATESVTALRLSLTIVEAMITGESAVWETLPFAVVRENLQRWSYAALECREVAASADAAADRRLPELQDLLAKLRTAWTADADLAAHTGTLRELGIGAPSSAIRTGVDVFASVRGALTYLAQFHESGLPLAVVDWLASGQQATRMAMLHRNVAALQSSLASAGAAEQRFADAGAVNLTDWYGVRPDGSTLSLRAARFDRAILAGASLPRYLTLLRARTAVASGAFPAACGLLESGAVPPGQLPDTYDYLLARTLAELVLRERPELAQFSGDLHGTRREQFVSLDTRFIELTKKVIAQRANTAPRIKGVGWGPVKNLSEQSLVEREIEKTRRHIPIREMFKRAGRAIQSLKPCIMMGPQAVAQYLPPGLFYFDLVVMDEASQMRPEDAIGAIARGSQLVVVGDQKQLGPTSFFDVQSSDDEEIEEIAAAQAAETADQEAPRGPSVLERSESILQAAARRYPTRMLRWHYRSKYPDLIAFSNQEFYKNELVLFPHPGCEREGDGLNFLAVEHALYSSSTNYVEAQAVLDAVRRHAAECPERTLLVATMNRPQRELVDSLIFAAEKDDPTLHAFRERYKGSLAPCDVKNLENVQGDERDVIYVSVTYGPNHSGTVSQLFGPINTVAGERRLNVLFTRAKYRLDVFCSFDPTILRVTEASPRGLCVLRDYLRFAKEGNLATGRFTAREPDSDFEIEVARELRACGYDVHPQVGVVGYFLDLAVVDPMRPGRYILAVECDGRTYHSAKSARDRDRLRQDVLESRGWNFHRIWSTDWFRDPRGETRKVVRRLESLVS